jgi:hypothetical protein
MYVNITGYEGMTRIHVAQVMVSRQHLVNSTIKCLVPQFCFLQLVSFRECQMYVRLLPQYRTPPNLCIFVDIFGNCNFPKNVVH